MSIKKYQIILKTCNGTKAYGLKLFYAAWLLFLSSNLYSQDIIFFKNGTKDTVKVLEIGTELIVYKKHFHPTGPTYKVLANEVVLIEFSDGTIEVIKTIPKPVDYSRNLPRNILMGNTLGLLAGNIHLGYENISADGYMGIRVNLIATVVNVLDLGLINTGIDFNFYPSGQGKTRYFIGPSLRVGLFDYEDRFGAMLINNGVAHTTKNDLYLGGQIGLGVGIIDTDITPYAFLMFNIGQRF